MSPARTRDPQRDPAGRLDTPEPHRSRGDAPRHRARSVSDDNEGGVLDMIKVENSGIISRPIEEVFAYVADQTNAP